MTSPSTLALAEASFKLEPLEGQIFAGYTTGHAWNGWACPLFTRDQAVQVVEAWRNAGYKADYDGASNTFRFAPIDTHADPDPGPERRGNRRAIRGSGD